VKLVSATFSAPNASVIPPAMAAWIVKAPMTYGPYVAVNAALWLIARFELHSIAPLL
jgi:hypothetical protein